MIIFFGAKKTKGGAVSRRCHVQTSSRHVETTADKRFHNTVAQTDTLGHAHHVMESTRKEAILTFPFKWKSVELSNDVFDILEPNGKRITLSESYQYVIGKFSTRVNDYKRSIVVIESNSVSDRLLKR